MEHQKNMTRQRSFPKKVLIVLWALFITGVLIIITFLVLDNLILPAYVNKYEITEVPDVIGLDYPQALDSLRAKNYALKLMVREDLLLGQNLRQVCLLKRTG